MSARYLLVDLESVQPAPAEVEHWMSDEGSAWVFHGPHQLKMLSKYTALGPRVTVVPISRPGKNSLDFHLVFYLGYLTSRHPESKFAVLSKDKGYDPAIAHARTLAFELTRIEGLGTESVEASRPVGSPKKAPSKKKLAAPKPGVTPTKPTAIRKAASAKKTPRPARKSAATVQAPSVAGGGKVAPPAAKRAGTRTLGAIYRDVLQGLRTHTPNRPKSRRALERHVQTQLGPEPAPDKVRAIVERLFTVEAVRQEGSRLVYFPVGRSDADRARLAVSPATRSAVAP